MNFKAKAKAAGRCAFAPCANVADKIYADERFRILACSQAHADIARAEVDKVPVELHKEYFK